MDTFALKIRTTMGRKKKELMEEAYTRISSGGTVNRTQDIDPLKCLFKDEGIVFKVSAMSAKSLHLIACQ
jgi:hypothetical protein